MPMHWDFGLWQDSLISAQPKCFQPSMVESDVCSKASSPMQPIS